MPQHSPPRIAFVLEQTLGHVTHGMNLRRSVGSATGIDPVWLPVPYREPDLWERVPIVRGNWSLRGSARARQCLDGAMLHAPIAALFMHTQTVALFSHGRLRQIPSLLSLDATPANMDRMNTGYGHQPTSNSALSHAKFLWSRAGFRAAHNLITWSQWAADSLTADYGIDSAKIRVVPPGIDMTEWRPGPHDSVPGEKLRLLFVGGDFARKGGETLLQAFREGDLHSDCVLDIVTPDKSAALGIAEAQGVRVHADLAANSGPLRALAAQADVFVLPTRADCLPLAVLEAMACGLPVITTTVGALPEAVSPNTNGLLIPPDDPSALAAAIHALCADAPRRRAMGNASRHIAESRFDAYTNYGTVLAMLKHLAGGTT